MGNHEALRANPLTRLGERVVAGIEGRRWIDPVSRRIQDLLFVGLRPAGRAGRGLMNLLNGSWFGHSIHPALTDIPIGAWTTSLVCDALDAAGLGRRADFRTASDAALAVGITGAVAAAATGLADWRYLHPPEQQRVGTVHGLLNTAALTAYVTSMQLRRRGDRAAGRWLGLLGFGLAAGSAYLGGYLVFRRHAGVDHAERGYEPTGFVPLIREADLREDDPQGFEAGGVGVVLVRHGGRLYALGDHCAHLGGPLAEGVIRRGGLVCPWHGSRFALDDGRVLDGPATAPQPTFEVRVRDGVIEVRRPYHPGEEGRDLYREDIERRTAGDGESSDSPVIGEDPMDARRVLFEHHELFRDLFRQIRATGPDRPERRRELYTKLADEFQMHGTIEEEIFYPSVRDITRLIPESRSEHRLLGDMVAAVAREDPASEGFDEAITSLERLLEHHAQLEERKMFLQVEALGRDRLIGLGHELRRRLEELRRGLPERLGREAERRLARLGPN